MTGRNGSPPNGGAGRAGTTDNPGLTRDYYRIEDESGHRFWLFRHGLYDDGAPTPPWPSPQWYIHGLFA